MSRVRNILAVVTPDRLEALDHIEEALRLARGLQWAEGIEHAERALAMLKRQAAPAPTAGGSESSGTFGRPDIERS